jgi:hypothetical protein
VNCRFMADKFDRFGGNRCEVDAAEFGCHKTAC